MLEVKCKFKPIPNEERHTSKLSIIGFKLYERTREYYDKLSIDISEEISDEKPFGIVGIIKIPNREIIYNKFASNSRKERRAWMNYITETILYQFLELLLFEKIELYRFKDSIVTYGGLAKDFMIGYELHIGKPYESPSWLEKCILKAIKNNKPENKDYSNLSKVIKDAINCCAGNNKRQTFIHPYKWLSILMLTEIAKEQEWLSFKKDNSLDKSKNDTYKILLSQNQISILNKELIRKEKRLDVALLNNKNFEDFAIQLRKEIESEIWNKVYIPNDSF